MNTRSRILENIRTSLGRGPLPEQVKAGLRSRLDEPEPGIRPHFDQDLTGRFIEKLEGVSGTARRVASIDDVPGVIGEYLGEHGLDQKLVMSAHQILKDVVWPDTWEVEERPARGEDKVSVTVAFTAVAETGTLAFLSGADSPTTLNFLPDDHIVVIPSGQIVSHLEDLWGLIGEQDRNLPRTVNLITGPSRTADVEQTIQLGAHGPRRLHVILIDSH